MKKIISILCCSLFAFSANAAVECLRVNGTALETIVATHFTDLSVQTSVLSQLRDTLAKNSSGCIYVTDAYALCTVGGLDNKNKSDFQRCSAFVRGLANSASDVFYHVCGADRGKSGGTEHCVKDVFNGILYGTQVQLSQGIGLARMYADVKFNDASVICNRKFDKVGIQDYSLMCKSADGRTFYEFYFDDLEETKDYEIRASTENAICQMHGVKYLPSGNNPNAAAVNNTANAIWPSACNTTDVAVCAQIAQNAKRLAYSAKIGSWKNGQQACVLSQSRGTLKLRTKYGIDNMHFRSSGIQLNAQMHLHDQIRQYVESVIAPTKLESFDCDYNSSPYYDGNEPDEVLTCRVNGYPVDFLFDDLSESWGITSRAGEQGMECIVRGGTYDGKHCLRLDQKQCDKLKQTSAATCPECKSVVWNATDGVCQLPASASGTTLQKGIVIGGIVAGAAAAAVITVATGGTGAAALTIVAVETAGAGIELAAQTKINKAADEFLLQSHKCETADCAVSLIGQHFERLANMTNDLNVSEEDAIDREMARLIELIPDDSEFLQQVLADGTTLAEREKGLFEADSWEPEQIWRAAGIALQLTSLVTAAGKWIMVGGKTVTTKIPHATDVMRLKLTRAQAKSLADLDGVIASITKQRQATNLSKSKADKLWESLKTAQQSRQTLLNKLGNPPAEALPLLQREAMAADELRLAQEELTAIARQQDELYMVNKNGQQVLKPGKTKYDVSDLARRNDAVAKQIDGLESELKTLDEQLNAMLGTKKIEYIEQTTTTPSRQLFNDGIAPDAVLAKVAIAEVKNQTRKEWDAVPAVDTVESMQREIPEPEVILDDIVIDDTIEPLPMDLNLPLDKDDLTVKPIPMPGSVVPPVKPNVVPEPIVDQNIDIPEEDIVIPDTKLDLSGDKLSVTPIALDNGGAKQKTPRNITPHSVERSGGRGWIAAATVAGLVGTGVLVGTLVGKDSDDSKSNATGATAKPELESLMVTAGGILGYVDNNEITLVPLPTTVNTNAPIVDINNRAVVVVRYKTYNLPYYLDAGRSAWVPLLGIGQTGGWFNTYPNIDSTGIARLDKITKTLNQMLPARTVLKYTGQNNYGVRFPFAASTAYSIINAEFPGGVVQTYNGSFTSVDRALYDRNYQHIKSVL
ncbi:MAG: hypothetical protein IKW57_01910 [Alphaproteobacteria bacterium]|nr:hypothetical protein [Alphaproteobacteria bacterium]